MASQQEIKGWLDWREACKAAGVGRRQLERLRADGVIQRRTDAGVYLYSRDDCNAYATGETKEPDEKEHPELRLLAQAYRMIDSLMAPAKLFSEMVAEDNQRKSERIRELEAQHTEMVKAREELLDSTMERQLLLDAHKAGDERKKFAMKQLAAFMPVLQAKLGTGQAGAAVELLGTLTQEQLELLLHTDLITEPQKALLRQCLGQTKSTNGAQKEPSNVS